MARLYSQNMFEYIYANNKQRTKIYVSEQATTGIMPSLRKKEAKNGKILILR